MRHLASMSLMDEKNQGQKLYPWTADDCWMNNTNSIVINTYGHLINPYDNYKTIYALDVERVYIAYFEYDYGKCSLV